MTRSGLRNWRLLRTLAMFHIINILPCTVLLSESLADDITLFKRFNQSVATNDNRSAVRHARQLIKTLLSDKFEVDPETRLTTMIELTSVLVDDGLHSDAADIYDRIIASYRRSRPTPGPRLAELLYLQAQTVTKLGEYQAAARLLQEAIAIAQKIFGKRHPKLLKFLILKKEIIVLNTKQNQLKCGSADVQFDVDFETCSAQSGFAAAPYSASQLPIVEEQLGRLDDGTEQRSVVNGATEGKTENAQIVPVFYGTNRTLRKTLGGELSYGHKRGKIEYGTVNVSVPKKREIGEIPEPELYRLEFVPNPDKHFFIKNIVPEKSIESFRKVVSGSVSKSKRREILIFVHGYNNTFQDAALRTAQLATDLEIDGASGFYSWPSRGGLLSYFSDGAQVIHPFLKDLADYIELLATEVGAERLYLAAHSMGGRYVLGALEKIARLGTGNRPIFDELVFASPDVDAEDFADRIQSIDHVSKRITLYVSAADTALKLSKYFNGEYPRAGDGTPPLVVANVETIDLTQRTRSLVGHTTLFGSGLDDFRALLWHSLAPASRCILQLKPSDKGAYWVLGAAHSPVCTRKLFNEAVLLRRRMTRNDGLQWLASRLASSIGPERLRFERLSSIFATLN